jgi:hypothetical protein
MKLELKLISFLLLFFIFSCKKDSEVKKDINDPVITKPISDIKYGNVEIKISNKVGISDLILNSGNYINMNGDSFTVSKFKYYISNIRLNKTDGSYYVDRDSYYLVDNNNGSNYTILLDSVPLGSYNGLDFILGVDSARNTSGAQNGALDPSFGMFWSWNQGYIFLMMEGNSPSSNEFNNALIFHLGGFTKPYNCIRSINKSFTTTELKSTAEKTSTIAMTTDLLKMFETPRVIEFNQTSLAMGGAAAVTIANNCVNMFSITSIKN